MHMSVSFPSGFVRVLGSGLIIHNFMYLRTIECVKWYGCPDE